MNFKPKLVAGTAAAVLALATPIVMYYEGTRNTVYLDPIGIPTVCTGSTYDLSGERLTDEDLGITYTKAECDTLLRRHIQEHAEILNCLNPPTPLTVFQAAALTSFAFNVGPGKSGYRDGMCYLRRGGPSRIKRLIDAGFAHEACAVLSDWTMAGGRELPGLIKRRATERSLCERKL